jgi:hypothetical protein
MNDAASALHASVSFVTVEDDSRAPVPRNWPSAGTKSPEDSPCRVFTVTHEQAVTGLCSPDRRSGAVVPWLE